MIILIAESKTMQTQESDIPAKVFEAHSPVHESIAAEIMASLCGLSIGEIIRQTNLSPSLASKLQKWAYNFPLKSTGLSAISAFTGVVFRALDFSSLSGDAAARGINDVRIVSSLYGLLKPDDIVKPYRLDFKVKLEEGPSEGKAMNSFWKPEVTKDLVKTLQIQGKTEILNLLPGDASNCIDWKLVKRFAKVWKVDFREMQEDGKTLTPPANRLKTLRGTLLRQILKEGIVEAAGLLHTVSEHYVCEGTPVYPDHLQFLC